MYSNFECMIEKKPIETIADVKHLVNTFYGKVRKNEILGNVFNQVIQDNWDAHLQTMYTFWETLLLGNQTYFGSPFPPHMKLNINKTHFVTWVKLFEETILENFEGEKAEEALWRAKGISKMFQAKLERLNHITK